MAPQHRVGLDAREIVWQKFCESSQAQVTANPV